MIRVFRKLHVSWKISMLSVSFVLGVVSAAFVDSQVGSTVAVLIAGVLLLAVGFARTGIVSLAFIVFGALLCGLWRGATVLEGLSVYRQFYGETSTVTGRITEDPSTGKGGDTQMRVSDILINGESIPGTIWVSTQSSLDIERSDIVSIEGRITEGFGTIPATMYQARVTTVQRPDYADVGRDVRDSFAGGLRQAIDEPQASLASGFIVGQKTTLPGKLDADLRLLGLTHIVVASGYNLSILVRYARKGLMRVSRFTALAGASSLVFGFTQLTGNSPSMARASLVTGISLVAWYYGRKIHPFVLLAVASGVTIVVNPSYAWGDLGWLLSFTSFIGVLILAPLLHSYLWADKEPGFVRRILFETMSAQVLTLPIIAYTFGQYTPLSLLANLLVLPLIPFVMGLGFFAGLAGLFAQPIAQLIGLPAQVVLSYMTSVIDYLALQPIAQSEITFSVHALVAAYVAIAALIVFLWRKSGHAFREYNIVE